MDRSILTVFVVIWCFGCGPKSVLDDAALNLVEARQAVADGDPDAALQYLDASISLRPDPWAYYERARLHAENGDDDAAKADVEAGLELDEEHSDLLWLQKQLKKPRQSRFTGKSGAPPSVNK